MSNAEFNDEQFKRGIEDHAEKIRVLREALKGVLTYASCSYESPSRSHFDSVCDRAQDALEKTR